MFLFNEKNCADICLKNTNKYVFKAVNDLINDFARVSKYGVKPKIVKTETQNCIVIEENARTSAEPVTDESYSITTEDGKAIIRANGYLGTMWGIYTFSENFSASTRVTFSTTLRSLKKARWKCPKRISSTNPTVSVSAACL